MTAVASRRGADGEIVTPAPFWRALPALYREPEEGFVRQFTEALDAVLAPVFCTLDNLSDYFDPKVAPEDFLDWLAGWVGLELYERWPPELRRKLVAEAVDLHQKRGTKSGVERIVEIFAGVERGVTIEESGGVSGNEGEFREAPTGRPDYISHGKPWIWVKIEVKRDAPDGEVETVTRVARDVIPKVTPAHVVVLVDVHVVEST